MPSPTPASCSALRTDNATAPWASSWPAGTPKHRVPGASGSWRAMASTPTRSFWTLQTAPDPTSPHVASNSIPCLLALHASLPDWRKGVHSASLIRAASRNEQPEHGTYRPRVIPDSLPRSGVICDPIAHSRLHTEEFQTADRPDRAAFEQIPRTPDRLGAPSAVSAMQPLTPTLHTPQEASRRVVHHSADLPALVRACGLAAWRMRVLREQRTGSGTRRGTPAVQGTDEVVRAQGHPRQ